jgi:hypothetical protein
MPNKQLLKTIDNFRKDAISQSVKGVAKYGKVLDPLDNYNWRTMAKEELADAYVYLDAEEDQIKFVAQKIRNLADRNCTDMVRGEINHWCDILEGK